jgi:hypothetical protein
VYVGIRRLPAAAPVQRMLLKVTSASEAESFERVSQEEVQKADTIVDTATVFSDRKRSGLVEKIKASGNLDLAYAVLLEWEKEKGSLPDLDKVRTEIAALNDKSEDLSLKLAGLSEQLDRAQDRAGTLAKEEERRSAQAAIDALRNKLIGLQSGKKVEKPEQAAPRQPVVLTPAMRRAYRQDMLSLGTWGSLDEADHVARAYDFSSRVYTVIGNQLVLIQQIGTGARRGGRDLIHRGSHYEVIRNANDGDPAAGVQIVSRTSPRGDCLFEALYIVMNGQAVADHRREAVVRRFRRDAVAGLTDAQVDSALTEIVSQGLTAGLGRNLSSLLRIQEQDGEQIKTRLSNLKTPPDKGEQAAINAYFVQLGKEKAAIRRLKALDESEEPSSDAEIAQKITEADATLKELETYLGTLERKYGVKNRRTDLGEGEQIAMLDMLRSMAKLIKGQYDESGSPLEEVQSILIDGTIIVTGNSMGSPADFTGAVGADATWSSGKLNAMYQTARGNTQSKTYARVQSDDLYKIKEGLNLLDKTSRTEEGARTKRIGDLQALNSGSLKKETEKAEKEVEAVATADLSVAYVNSPKDAAAKLGSSKMIVLTPPAEGGWHAEQYLLVVVAQLLKSGIVPKQVLVSGVKEPCSACLAVLQEHRLAFWEAAKTHLIFDTRPVPGASQKHMHKEEVHGKSETHEVYKPGSVPNAYWKAFLQKLGIVLEDKTPDSL